LALGALDLCGRFPFVGVEFLGLPVLHHDLRPLGGTFAEELLDLPTRLINRHREGGNHLRQLQAIVLMERTDERRFQVRRKVKIPDVEPGLNLREGKALLVAEIQRAFSMPTPLDDLKGCRVKVAVVILNRRKAPSCST
jgi:hypothetical protein